MTVPHNPPPNKKMSRRLFLRVSGAAGVVIGAAVVGRDVMSDPVVRTVELPVQTTYLRRREDMLNLRISTVNLHVADLSRPQLTKRLPGQPAYLVIDLGPQAAQERSFHGSGAPGQAPVSLEWGGASRLAFDVTDHVPLPYTTEALLRWAGFAPRLVPNAQGRTAPDGFRGDLRAPTGHETALEVPFGVIVSPDSTSGWCHAETTDVPESPSGWSELWHTRLGTRVHDEDDDSWSVAEDDTSRVLRAVWLPDPRFPDWLGSPASVPDAGPYTTSLTPRNRYDLVRLSSDFSLSAPPASGLPAPIEADALSLSALGATLDAHGAWDTSGSGFSSGLAEWSHHLTQGRDQKVRVVQHGYLLPFGHRAAYMRVTERQIERDAGGVDAGYLRTRDFLVVLEPERDYASHPHMPDQGKSLPFRTIRALTRTTASLDDPATTTYGASSAPPAPGSDTAYAFMAKVDSAPLPLHFVGVDWDGRRVPFTAPVVFVSEKGAASQRLRNDITRLYNTQTTPVDPGRLGRVDGRTLALAPAARPGDTSLVVRTLTFAVTATNPATTGTAGFPTVARLTADLPTAVRALVTDPAEAVLEYYQGYLQDGFDRVKNAGGVYLAKARDTTAQALSYAADKSGGLVTPGLAVDGMSRVFGPVAGDLAQAALQRFDPGRMFGELDTRILGGIRLRDVLAPLTGGAANAEQAMKVISEEFHRVEDGIRKPERVEARLHWRPKLKAGPGSLRMFVPGADGSLHVEAVSVARLLPPLEATYSVRGELRDVSLNIWGDSGPGHFVTVGVRVLRFTAAKGRQTDIDCELGEVSFHGPLKYLEEVARLCRLSVPGVPGGGAAPSAARASRAAAAAGPAPSGGTGSPLSVAVVGRQIQAELSLALPSLSFGIFALNSMTLFAGLYLPFDGSPVRFRFALNSREAPFSLTLSFLGGGGFFALEAGADGVESLEAALEAGAGTSFDVAGVVSGHVEAKIGIYFGVRTVAADGGATAQQVELSAYVRLGGRVEVLGLVSASLDCYLALTYFSQPDRLVGEAHVTISIDLGLFETSVSFGVRRELAGGGSTSSAARASRSAVRDARRSTAVAAGAAAPAAVHSFSDSYSQQDWSSYCTAFAPVGA
ncbi:hypothetical protein ACFYZ4_26010 [Streptomyces sp. NPDC001513]|uniref:hypothetical protein n=1 Tax=Streptomyces sp. NPDC001513 TaxID=3364580 RepID=UPI0036C242C2